MGNRNSLKRVLTIQSHVTYGYVGNSAAVFSLQRLGIEAMPLHTVQFSNHTGYELFTGDIFSAEHLRSVVSGLEQNHILERIDAVLTGYLGSTETGDVVAEIVAKIRAKNPELLYLCDPVMGDKEDNCGLFVHESIPPLMRDSMLSIANIITPNHFEFELVCNQKVTTIAEAYQASKALFKAHETLSTIVITSFNSTKSDAFVTLLFSRDGQKLRVETPRLERFPMPSGMGDTFSALYLGHILQGKTPEYALSYTTSTLYAFVNDSDDGQRDLSMIREQAQIIRPNVLFTAMALEI